MNFFKKLTHNQQLFLSTAVILLFVGIVVLANFAYKSYFPKKESDSNKSTITEVVKPAREKAYDEDEILAYLLKYQIFTPDKKDLVSIVDSGEIYEKGKINALVRVDYISANSERDILAPIRLYSLKKVDGNWQFEKDISDDLIGVARGSVYRVGIQDMNDDSIKDILVVQWNGAGANVGYRLWLNESDKFVEVKDFEKLSQPRFKDGKFYSHNNNGCAGACFTDKTYSFENNELKLLTEVNQDFVFPDSKECDSTKYPFYRVYYEYTNGVKKQIKAGCLTETNWNGDESKLEKVKS